MEQRAFTKDYVNMTPDELRVQRWNSFLEGDLESLKAIMDEATYRMAARYGTPEFRELEDIADGCHKDMQRLNHYMEQNNGTE